MLSLILLPVFPNFIHFCRREYSSFFPTVTIAHGETISIHICSSHMHQTKHSSDSEMYRSNVEFPSLPNEVLLMILKKLNNMDVLSSLFGVDVQRLDLFLQHETFSHSLDFTSKTIAADSIFDRFCIDILAKMNHCVRSLIVESGSMGRVLLAGDYLHLTQLQIFNFTGCDIEFNIDLDKKTCLTLDCFVLFRSISML